MEGSEPGQPVGRGRGGRRPHWPSDGGSSLFREKAQPDSPEIKRLLAGDWPPKRNIVIIAKVSSTEEGKDLLRRLRASIPDSR